MSDVIDGMTREQLAERLRITLAERDLYMDRAAAAKQVERAARKCLWAWADPNTNTTQMADAEDTLLAALVVYRQTYMGAGVTP